MVDTVKVGRKGVVLESVTPSFRVEAPRESPGTSPLTNANMELVRPSTKNVSHQGKKIFATRAKDEVRRHQKSIASLPQSMIFGALGPLESLSCTVAHPS